MESKEMKKIKDSFVNYSKIIDMISSPPTTTNYSQIDNLTPWLKNFINTFQKIENVKK